MLKRFVINMVYRLRGEYTTEKLIHMGMKVGGNFQRQQGVILDPSHCWLIHIGNNVTIAPRVHILAHDASTYNAIGYSKIGRVILGDNVFVGAESVILPNVKIGDNVIIGANSTVTKNIPANSVFAGSPAKFICTYEEYIEKEKMQMCGAYCYDEEYTLRKNINNYKKIQMNDELKEKMGYVK